MLLVKTVNVLMFETYNAPTQERPQFRIKFSVSSTVAACSSLLRSVLVAVGVVAACLLSSPNSFILKKLSNIDTLK